MLELAPSLEPRLDPRALRRLVALETTDLDVPALPGQPADAPLYFRVSPAGPLALRVELFHLGAPEGARAVAAAGSPALRARRVALAAGELARQLRGRRQLLLARRAATGSGGPPASDADGRFVLRGTLDLLPGLSFVSWPAAATWALGPSLGAAATLDSGARVELGGAWLQGDGAAGGPLRLAEARLGLSFDRALGASLRAGGGAVVALGAARVTRAAPVGEAPPLDRPTARAGARVRAELAASRAVSFVAATEVGAWLLPVRGAAPGGDPLRLGGLSLAGELALRLTPARF